jgi:hypothetical protein
MRTVRFPRQPARLVDNAQTWLRFTDLVFIDPVGTGFSREGPRGPDNSAQTRNPFWGIEGDLHSLGEFIILHGDILYIGAAGTGSILAFDIPATAPHGKLAARTIIDGHLKAPSGFAIGPDGDLYVGERFNQRVQRYSVKGKKKKTFIDGLPDMPEFLVHVPDRA